MNKIALLTDSCADISPDLIEKYDIYVVPLKVRFGEEEYLDGLTITPKEVYERQKTEIPKTSLPDGKWIEDTFDKIKNNGQDCHNCIHVRGCKNHYNGKESSKHQKNIDYLQNLKLLYIF